MSSPDLSRASTGIDGLDEVLEGGLIARRNYMLRGPAGAGKTILGFHFLQAGVDAGGTAVFVNLEEDLDDLKANAASLGFDVDAMEFLDFSPSSDVFTEDESYDVFPAADVEQEPMTEELTARIREIGPDRVVVDPLTQFWYLTGGEYQFRKRVVGFTRFLKEQGATVLFTAQETKSLPTEELQFLSDGTILLSATPAGREIEVPKFRGSAVRRGDHAFRITGEGIVVYPDMMPGAPGIDVEFVDETLSSGVPEVDELLHGGIERGTVTIISGPTGVGKTTLGTQFMKENAGRGGRSVIFLFEETKGMFLNRSEAINIPVRDMIERGTLHVEEIEALDQSPQEFAQRVRHEVEEEDADIVMIDGISGYRLTLRGGGDRTVQRLHALGRYLKAAGVTSILVDETADVTGPFNATEENVSYLADSIVFLRHLELDGELRKAIGVLKKRTSDYERNLRRYEITRHGIKVGEPLTGLRGILSGTPEWVGERDRGPARPDG